MKADPIAVRQGDLFALDVRDLSLRDQRDMMEIPFFSLAKNRRTPIEYKSADGKQWIKISPNVSHGVATIWDKDVLIWIITALHHARQRAVREGLDPNSVWPDRTIRVHPAELLRSICRHTGGRAYMELKAALERLTFTANETNRAFTHFEGRRWVWIQSFTWSDERIQRGEAGIEITVSEWLYRSVSDYQYVLEIEREYFTLTGGYERWLYTTARKHAHMVDDIGRPFVVSLERLYARLGQNRPFRKFKAEIKRVIEKTGGEILGYSFHWDERPDGVVIRMLPRDTERNQVLADVHRKRRAQATIERKRYTPPSARHQQAFKQDAAFYAKDIRSILTEAQLARLGERHPWASLAGLWAEYLDWIGIKAGAQPKSVYAHFSAFLKRKGEQQTKRLIASAGRRNAA